MSAVVSPARAALRSSVRTPRKLVVLALAVALAATALTFALTASGGPAPRAAHVASAQRQYLGGPAEGRGLQSTPSPGPANDGSQHSGARP
jgi:hypothetical protein